MAQKKAQDMTNALLSLILGLMVLGALIFAIFNTCFRDKGDEGLKSFNELCVALQTFYDDPRSSKESHPLIMDDQTTIIGFTKRSDSVKLYLETGLLLEYPRPTGKCPEGSACICLCRAPFDQRPVVATCPHDKFTCKSFSGLDFPSVIRGEIFTPFPTTVGYALSDGFIYNRNAKGTNNPVLVLPFRKEKLGVVLLQRLGSAIALCENPDPDEGCTTKKALQDADAEKIITENFKLSITLCQEREDNLCSCTPFNYQRIIPEGYNVKLYPETDMALLSARLTDKEGNKITDVLQGTRYYLFDVTNSQITLNPENLTITRTAETLTTTSNGIAMDLLFDFDDGTGENKKVLLLVKCVTDPEWDDVCFGMHPAGETWTIRGTYDVQGPNGEAFDACGFTSAGEPTRH